MGLVGYLRRAIKLRDKYTAKQIDTCQHLRPGFAHSAPNSLLPTLLEAGEVPPSLENTFEEKDVQHSEREMHQAFLHSAGNQGHAGLHYEFRRLQHV